MMVKIHKDVGVCALLRIILPLVNAMSKNKN